MLQLNTLFLIALLWTGYVSTYAHCEGLCSSGKTPSFDLSRANNLQNREILAQSCICYTHTKVVTPTSCPKSATVSCKAPSCAITLITRVPGTNSNCSPTKTITSTKPCSTTCDEECKTVVSTTKMATSCATWACYTYTTTSTKVALPTSLKCSTSSGRIPSIQLKLGILRLMTLSQLVQKPRPQLYHRRRTLACQLRPKQ